MSKFLTGLSATILSMILLTIATIAMYANVEPFKEMVDYALSLVVEEPVENDDAIADNEEEVKEPSIDEPVVDAPIINEPEYSPAVSSVSYVPVVDNYVAPAEEPIEGVVGRASLEPVHEYSKTLTDNQADVIEETLGTGNTGDGLTFDTLFYPYFNMLTNTEQTIYRQIYANAMDKNQKFRSVIKDVEIDDVQDAFVAVYYDHPELYWLDKTFYTYYRKNGDFLELDLSFNDVDPSAFENAAASLAPTGDAYSMEKSVHDSLTSKNTYSYASPRNQSAYSAMVEGTSVCAGYSRAFQYLMQQQGIPCYFCVGFAGEPHAWNIIYLDGEYYNVDVTWDDTDDERVNTYTYFNKSDDEYSSSHIRQGMSVNLPACNGSMNVQGDTSVNDILSQYGLSEESTYNSLSDYTAMMCDILDQTGDYTFYSVVSKDLYNPLFDAIKYQVIDSEVMYPVLENVGGSQYSYYLTPTELPNGSYLIENRVIIR